MLEIYVFTTPWMRDNKVAYLEKGMDDWTEHVREYGKGLRSTLG